MSQAPDSGGRLRLERADKTHASRGKQARAGLAALGCPRHSPSKQKHKPLAVAPGRDAGGWSGGKEREEASDSVPFCTFEILWAVNELPIHTDE